MTKDTVCEAEGVKKYSNSVLCYSLTNLMLAEDNYKVK